MPHLFCRTCGRRIYTVSPLSSMAGDERRCPRCGTQMQEDRRGPERRMTIRRENPANDPGPPPAAPVGDTPPAALAGEARPAASAGKKKPKSAAPENPERRVADRRSGRRRGGGSNLPPAAGGDSAGWQD
jgi:hypothetical protein